jgi:hypothetical protein
MMTATPTYRSWAMMLVRTRDKRDKHYGGAAKPVKVCKRWLRFELFLKDMGIRPKGTTLSRFADTGDYRPGNVSWHDRRQQGLERRKRFAMLKGEKCDTKR